jgi:hypothetical protein
VKIAVEVIRSNYASHSDVQSAKTELAAVRQKLDSVLPHLATKEDVQTARAETRALAEFEAVIPRFATKADLHELRSDTRTWIVATAITLMVALGGMQFSFYSMLKDSLAQQIAATKRLENEILPAKPAMAPVPDTNSGVK